MGLGALVFSFALPAGAVDYAPLTAYAIPNGVELPGRDVPLVIEDVNGDGRQDLVMASVDHAVVVMPQSATGALGQPQRFPFADGSIPSVITALAAADVDGDGRNDVAVSTGIGVYILYGTSSGELGGPHKLDPTLAFGVAIGDIDDDGRKDIVASTDYGTKAYRNTGDGFAPATLTLDTFEPLRVGDLTGDGRIDVVGGIGGRFTVLAQQPDSSFLRTRYRFGVDKIALGDFTGDGRLDLAAAARSNSPWGHVRIYTQTTAGILGPPVAYGTYDLPGPLVAADADADGRTDIVVAHDGWDRVGVLTQQGDGTLSREQLFHSSTSFAARIPGGALAVGDLDGRGLPDIAVIDGSLNVLHDGTGAADSRQARTTITSGPPTVTDATSASFSYTVDAPNALVQCSLDGASASLCPGNPAVYTNLTPGAHTIAIRISSSNIGKEPVAAFRLWHVGAPELIEPPPNDTTPPETVLESYPPDTTSSTSATFSFGASEPVSYFECKLNRDLKGNTGWSHCGFGPIQYFQLPPGTHTFGVRAVDSAGNVDRTPASWTWTITPPPPFVPANDMFAQAWAIPADTAAAGVVTTNATKEPGEPDHAGNAGGHSIWLSWTPVTTGEVTIDTASTAFDTLLAVYTGASLPALTLIASNDDAGTGVTTSSVTFVAVAGTTYMIAVDGKNGASGNGSLGIVWTRRDTTAPETTITAGPAGSIASTDASFSFASSESDSTFECRLDGSGWSVCSSPTSYVNLGPATHRFDVRATDVAGNVDQTPAGTTWTIVSASANLIPNGSFEGSLAGWRTHNGATLSLVSGTIGVQAAKVTAGSGSTPMLQASPRPVVSTTAGAAYSLRIWLRGATPGLNVCQRLRERSPSGSRLAETKICAKTTTGWWQLPAAALTATRSGSSIEVHIYATSATAGRSFELDGITLTRT